MESGPVALSVLVSVDLKWSSSVVEWMCSACSAEEFNNSSEDQETDNTPITRPLNDLLLCTHPLATHLPVTYCTT